MWLIRAALRRPISVIVIVVALALTSILALLRSRIDIFPELDLPVIYVAQPYGGMSPQQMEGFLAYYYEYHFLYINGIENVEAKTIQGTALLRLTFHPGTDMSQALAQTISYVNRARAFMPPGTVSPFVIRYDAGTLPVGYLVFNSSSRTLGEIQDFALNRVRPVFATLPGVSSPPPFGGNQRTIVINVDPAKLHAYGLSPENVVQALISGNSIEPAGQREYRRLPDAGHHGFYGPANHWLARYSAPHWIGSWRLLTRCRKRFRLFGHPRRVCGVEWEADNLHSSHQETRCVDHHRRE